jgi:cytochrome c
LDFHLGYFLALPLAFLLADPTAWVKAASGDDAAKSKMSYKVAEGGEDLAAYLATFK